ncbi:RpiB/LacA/LacB family sugar-phosphate isomerase [Candidatus Saccharibacteria bacterium]|nr:RpiB/LacA/LacB family sugar-phosphate isomerase [Candidatus Saccharibacteria bacterium]
MEIFIGADYRGFLRKQYLLEKLSTIGADITDLGCYDVAEGEDYNDVAVAVAQAVRENRGSRGILICDSAHGMTMQANRYRGVRAVNCDSVESAKLAREHDDANVVCLSAQLLDDDATWRVVQAFLETEFEPLERRVRRINRLDEREDYA